MKLLVDASIILDFLLQRQPYVRNARLLLELGKLGEFSLYMSASQIPDLHYVLSNGNKADKRALAKQFFASLRQFVSIAPMGEDEMDSALAASQKNFDDACLFQAARTIKAHVIITHNQESFASSLIPAVNCEEFFAWLEEKKGVAYAELVLD